MQRMVGAGAVGRDGLLKWSSAVDMMQDCSLFQLERMGEITEYFHHHGVGMYLVSRQADWIRRPSFGETLTVRTVVYRVKSMYGYRNTVLFDERGKMCAQSYAIGAFVDLSTGRPIRMPETLLNRLVLDEEIPMEQLPRKIPIPEQGGEAFEEFRIPKNFEDFNGHVNNARYVELAEEYAHDFSGDRIRVEYKTPARWNDFVIPVVYREKEGEPERRRTVALTGRDGTLYASVEFSCRPAQKMERL